jgi:hypothetical protein
MARQKAEGSGDSGQVAEDLVAQFGQRLAVSSER